MSAFRAETARTKIATLSRAGLPWQEFGLETMAVLHRAVPFDGACFGTIDPQTNFITGSVKVDIGDPCEVQFAHHEYVEDTVSLFVDLVAREVGVAVLHDETEGDPRRSSRFRDLIAPVFGFGHELRSVLRNGGRSWGAVAIYRGGSTSGFSPAEAEFVDSVSAAPGLGIRTGMIAVGGPGQQRIDFQAAADGPAVVVFDATDRVVAATPAAEQRMADLGGSLWGETPVAVASTLAATRALGSGRSTVVPRTTIRSASGEWLTVHAAALTGAGHPGQIAVTVERAAGSALLAMVVAALGLTSRERDVVALVLRGEPTSVIATTLHLSPYTVQDHLKSVFAKAEVSSRRELMSRVYFDHYAPRYGQDLGADGWYTSGRAGLTPAPEPDPVR